MPYSSSSSSNVSVLIRSLKLESVKFESCFFLVKHFFNVCRSCVKNIQLKWLGTNFLAMPPLISVNDP